MTKQNNPLGAYFRSPKLWTNIPSNGVYYDDTVIDMPENGELEVYAMTAKDELMLKNPDALLNGEAVVNLISSCVPQIKNPRKLVKNDVDVLLVAIQGATNGTIDVTAKCDKCEGEVQGQINAEDLLSTMDSVKEVYDFTNDDGLIFVVRPYSFEASVEAGLVQFRSTQSLQRLADIDDDLERIRAFSDNIKDLAALEYSLLVESVQSITIPPTEDGEDPIVISDSNQIQEYFDNCDKKVGKKVVEKIAEINDLGIDRTTKVQCEACSTEDKPYLFDVDLELNPVNFFIAS